MGRSRSQRVRPLVVVVVVVERIIVGLQRAVMALAGLRLSTQVAMELAPAEAAGRRCAAAAAVIAAVVPAASLALGGRERRRVGAGRFGWCTQQ